MTDESYDVLIAGGGAAGLAHAFFRRRAEPSLRLLVAEAGDRAGGWVRTVRREGFTCEAGPQGFRPNADTDALIAATGLAEEVLDAAPAAKKRWVLRGERLVALPGGPLQFLTSQFLSIGAKLSLLAEPWRTRGSDPEESMGAFVARRFGAGTRPLAEALAHGIFAGDADRLEMASMFPQAVAIEQQHGSLVRGMLQRRRGRRQPRVRRPALCTFRGGMQTVVERLAALLGDDLALSTPVRVARPTDDGWLVELGGARPRVVRARQVVLAVPAPAAATIVASFDDSLAGELRAIRAASVASVWLGAPRQRFAHALDGFGCLAPKHDSSLLGILVCSSVFPGHAPEGHALLRVMSGGADHPDELSRSDDELRERAVGFARACFGFAGESTFTHVERCRNAIAQYEIGHRARLTRLASLVAPHRGLALLGASYRQIAVVGQWTAEGSHP